MKQAKWNDLSKGCMEENDKVNPERQCNVVPWWQVVLVSLVYHLYARKRIREFAGEQALQRRLT